MNRLSLEFSPSSDGNDTSKTLVVFFYVIFRSHYLIKVPFYLGGSFLFVSGLTRDFPISLRRLQAGLAWGKEREEFRQKSKWQLPLMEELTGPPIFDGLTSPLGAV